MSSTFSRPEAVEECESVARSTGPFHRVFDALVAALGLLFLSPLFLLIAAAIKLDDGGAVFYAQDRVGKNFKLFRVYKFRTMVPGADRDGLLTVAGDARLTHTGGWLRRYKLDELPQLVNVLKGDMQLVGARPEVEKYVQMFHLQYAMILQDRPGITDPATLAFRHEEQMLFPGGLEQQYVTEILPKKLSLALEYQKQRSFLSDVG